MTTYSQNLLLAALPGESIRSLSTHMSIVSIPTRGELFAPGDQVDRIYFPLTGVASITSRVSGTQGEVATVGMEGLVGLPVIWGTNVAVMRIFMQVGGDVVTIPAAQFAIALEEDVTLRSLVLRYSQALFIQVGQSVVCNQRHSLRQRCARWLLMTHDRMPSDEFHLTHEFLAVMLGVRRAGVTVAAGQLQSAGLIQYHRGTITILNRAGLERVACECYRFVCDAYTHLIGAEPQAPKYEHASRAAEPHALAAF